MKPNRKALCAFVLAGALAAVAGAEPVISGLLLSRLESTGDPDAVGEYAVGLEEYANLRLKADAGDRGTVYAAVNLVAASGSLADPAAMDAGQNYSSAIELERLYVKIRGPAVDLESGLLRLPFGYGQAFRPTDFLNPPHPLIPDARPRAVLGGSLAAYPSDASKLRGFVALGPDPGQSDGGGAVFGAAADHNADRFSVQALYALRTPESAATDPLHRGGLSVKAEAGAALVLDAMYSWDGAALDGWDGLRGAAGADYSILDGDLYLLAQYLYNGPRLLDAGTLPEVHYLYAQAHYRLDDYTAAGISALTALDAVSYVPAVSVEREFFQGCTADLRLSAPADRDGLVALTMTAAVRVRF